MWDKHDGQLADSEPPITKKCRLAAQEAKEPESFANAKRRFSNRRVTASPNIASVFSNWHFAMLFTGVSGLLRQHTVWEARNKTLRKPRRARPTNYSG